MDGEDRRDGGDAAVEAAGDSIDMLVCARPTADGRRRAQELVTALQATGVAAVCDTVADNVEESAAQRRQRFTEDVVYPVERSKFSHATRCVSSLSRSMCCTSSVVSGVGSGPLSMSRA